MASTIGDRVRRRLGFSLRTLLIVVTVVCLVLGLKVSQVQRQREAVQALAAERVMILWDYHVAGQTEPSGPRWLRRWLGDDFFAHVEMLGFTVFMLGGPVSDNVDDNLLVHLRSLPRVKHILLDGCEKVTDRGLAHFASLSNLEELHLAETSVTGDGFDALCNLDRLKVLMLDGAPVTDDNLAKLPPLENLEELWLAETAITDESIPHLKRLAGLKVLDLSLTEITPEGFERVQTALPDCEIFEP